MSMHQRLYQVSSSYMLADVLSPSSGVWLQDRQYSKAARMALDLQHPGQLMATIVASMEHRSSQEGSSEAALAITQGLPTDSIKTLLKYLRQWNTNPRHCHAAQHVLQSLLRSCSAQVCSHLGTTA